MPRRLMLVALAAALLWPALAALSAPALADAAKPPGATQSAGTTQLAGISKPAGPTTSHATSPKVAYIPHFAKNVVTPINLVTHRAGTPVKVGIGPDAIAVSPDGQTAYVACSGSNTVVPINTATGRPGRPIPVGARPVFIAITPDGSTAYVADNGSSQVTPVNLTDNQAEPAISVGRFPRQIAITPDGATAYVVSNRIVTPIATKTRTALGRIAVGKNSRAIAITPNGKTAYVLNTFSDTISPISTATNKAMRVIHVGGFPHQIVITPNSRFAYVTLSRTTRKGYVAPIKISTNTALKAFRVGHRPTAMAITPDGKTVYVVNRHDSVTPIRTATNTPQKFIQVGTFPDGIAVTPDGRFAYVVSGAPESGKDVGGQLTFIDTATNLITQRIGIATDPVGIGLAAPTATVTVGTAVPAPLCTNKIAPGPQLRPAIKWAKVPGPPFGVAVTDDEQWDLAGIGNNVGVVRITATGGKVTHLIRLPAGDSARGEGLTPDGKYLLVANLKQGADVINVARAIAGKPGALLGTLDVPAPAKGAFEVEFSADGKFAFVTMAGEKEVAVFNLGLALSSGFGPADFVGGIPVAVTTVGIAASPDHRWLYITSEISVPGGTRGVLTTANVAKAETDPAGSVASNVDAGCRPVRVTATPNGQTVWVTARQSNAIVAFSARKLVTDPRHALLTWVRVGVQPIGIAAVNCGADIAVADSHRFKSKFGVPNVAIVDVHAALTGRPAIVGFIRSGLVPRELDVAPDGRSLLVGNYGSGQLETVSLTALPGASTACPF